MARKKKESVKFDVNSEKSKEFVAPMDKFLRLSSLLFNDEDDVTYASVYEADKYDQEHFKEFKYLDR